MEAALMILTMVLTPGFPVITKSVLGPQREGWEVEAQLLASCRRQREEALAARRR